MRKSRLFRGSMRPWLLLLLAAALGSVAALTVMRADAPGESRGSCYAALIPSYVPPAELAALATPGPREGPPRIAVLNPASGPGGAPDASFRAAAEALQRSGTRVLGYVHTGYGTRPPDDVQADVDRYRSWYGVDGIFLDEASSGEGHLAYYRTLSDRLRASGAGLLVLNPGRVPAEGYMDAADVVVTFEGPFAEYQEGRPAPDWLRGQPRERIAHLVYGASREQALRAVDSDSGAGYLLFTDGKQLNPWAAAPSYLPEVEKAMHGPCA